MILHRTFHSFIPCQTEASSHGAYDPLQAHEPPYLARLAYRLRSVELTHRTTPVLRQLLDA